MISFNVYTLIITFGLLAPIIGSISLFSILAFEHQIDSLKNENMKVNLEKELQHSEYMQLNQQIQPHFLFNTMNLVIGLARLKKNDKLIEVLEHLALFLKFKYNVREQLIPLSEELDYTTHYLTIQQIRLGDRLEVIYEIDEDCDLGVVTPPYMLQTLVENAFKHSLEKKIGPIQLKVRFTIEDWTACLEVIDNGIGVIEENFSINNVKGHGLKNIQSRLQLLFGNKCSLKLSQVPTGGVKATILWPCEKKTSLSPAGGNEDIKNSEMR